MNTKKYHFITGLPRSGSTLLSSILLQNPKFHASISDALKACIESVLISIGSVHSMNSEISIEKRKNIIHGIFEGFYKNNKKSVIFNTNRGWTYLTPLISELYPESKFIVCVRDINWILDSFELAQRRTPFTHTSYGGNISSSVFERTNLIMENDGIVFRPYYGIKQAIVSNEKHKLHFVEYDNLCKNPEEVIRGIYSFIGEEYYEHDFNNVERSWDEYDLQLGVKLHSVRKKVEYIEREFILPPDILHQYANMEFWRQYY
jgi:sulfotransferase